MASPWPTLDVSSGEQNFGFPHENGNGLSVATVSRRSIVLSFHRVFTVIIVINCINIICTCVADRHDSIDFWSNT